MSRLKKRERVAIEAVARHFSATWDASEEPSGAHLSMAGKRIAVEATTIKQPIDERTDPPKFRLRFDKVARRLVAQLQAALGDSVPDGTAVLFTITAPIWLPGKTAEALERKISAQLGRRSTPVPCKATLHGNQIRIRWVQGGSPQIPKVIGLVHNPGPDPEVLLDLMQAVLKMGAAAAKKRTRATSANQRWLVVAIEGGFSPIETYRQAYAELSIRTGFTKILLVFAGERVETLVG